MKTPITLTKSGVQQSWTELLVLFVLIVFAARVYFEMNWLYAMLTAPALMLTLLLGLMIVVHSLWLFVIGLERIGVACGFRKSPLS